jgi:hypothetical protein
MSPPPQAAGSSVLTSGQRARLHQRGRYPQGCLVSPAPGGGGGAGQTLCQGHGQARARDERSEKRRPERPGGSLRSDRRDLFLEFRNTDNARCGLGAAPVLKTFVTRDAAFDNAREPDDGHFEAECPTVGTRASPRRNAETNFNRNKAESLRSSARAAVKRRRADLCVHECQAQTCSSGRALRPT